MADEDDLPEVDPFNPINEKTEKLAEMGKMMKSYSEVIQISPSTVLAKFEDTMNPDKDNAFKFIKSVDQEFVDKAAEAAKVYLKNAQLLLDELKALEGM